MVVKNAELLKKQELLDALYAKVIQRFDTLPEKEVEALFVEMLKKLPTSGILHVSKKHAKILKKIAPNFQEGNPLEESGFILETEIADYDCRISTLVQEQVRPKTEISLSHSLFL